MIEFIKQSNRWGLNDGYEMLVNGKRLVIDGKPALVEIRAIHKGGYRVYVGGVGKFDSNKVNPCKAFCRSLVK